MSKKKLRRGVGGSDPTIRYVGLPHLVLNSQAWKTLPGDAIKLLIDVWKRHNGVNNGEITYGCREAQEIGLSRSATARNFDVLIERGFLVVVRDASFDIKQLSRIWRITAERTKGQPATKDFMRWQNPMTRARAPKHFPVPPAGLSDPIPAVPQSHQRDTYSIPCRGDAAPPPTTKRERERQRYLKVNTTTYGHDNTVERWNQYEQCAFR